MNDEILSKILDKVRGSKKILINCHRSPDPDSAGSALGLYLVLKKLGKEATIICPDNLPEDIKFLPSAGKVRKINFSKFDFSGYDLFLILDSANTNLVTGKKDIPLPEIFKIVIDHHKTNKKFGDINFIDAQVSSCAELIYKIYKNWKITPDKDMATALLTGILGDTGVFEYPGVGVTTLDTAKELILLGADKDNIILNIFRTVEFAKIKFWGEIISKMELDKEYGFVWSAVPYEKYVEFGRPASAKETAASMFSVLVKDTDFGIIMLEDEKKVLSVSFRSRTGFDVSDIALALDGGGHRAAAATKLYGLSFDEAVLKVLETARKYAKKVN